MDKNQIRKDIEGLIINIKEHFDNALDQDHIPQLELEMIVSKIEKLHQKAIIFHYVNEKHHIINKEQKVIEPDAITPSQMQTDLFGGTLNPKPIPAVVPKPEPKPEKIVDTPVEDIRMVIGINEKFQFVNDLFEGNQNEYTAAINQLNNYGSFSEAEAYLNSIKDIYKWEDESPMVEKFIHIVRRKLK